MMILPVILIGKKNEIFGHSLFHIEKRLNESYVFHSTQKLQESSPNWWTVKTQKFNERCSSPWTRFSQTPPICRTWQKWWRPSLAAAPPPPRKKAELVAVIETGVGPTRGVEGPHGENEGIDKSENSFRPSFGGISLFFSPRLSLPFTASSIASLITYCHSLWRLDCFRRDLDSRSMRILIGITRKADKRWSWIGGNSAR